MKLLLAFVAIFHGLLAYVALYFVLRELDKGNTSGMIVWGACFLAIVGTGLKSMFEVGKDVTGWHDNTH